MTYTIPVRNSQPSKLQGVSGDPGNVLGLGTDGLHKLTAKAIAAALAEAGISFGPPVGVVQAWPTNTPPDGWLICDGSAFSSSTYPELAAVLGGTTLPNYKGRTLVGKDTSQAEFDSIGETGGAKTHTLVEAEMPSHTHSVDVPSHTHSVDVPSHTHSVDVPSHSHTIPALAGTAAEGTHIPTPNGYTQLVTAGQVGTGGARALAFAGGSATAAGGGGLYPNNIPHTHPVTTGPSTTGATDIAPFTSGATDIAPFTTGATDIAAFNSGAKGSGGAHNNLQPYAVVNYIIKAV